MRFLYQLGSTWLHFGSKNLPKSRLGGVLGRLGRVLEASWGVLGASWSVLGASWGVLGRKIGFPLVLSCKKSERGPRFPAPLGRREPPNFQIRRTLLQENNTPDLYRPPYNARRHAAGRLRARCGSNAQQSCVPATAPNPEVTNQQV